VEARHVLVTQACPNGQKDIETKRLLIDIEKGMDGGDTIVFEEVLPRPMHAATRSNHAAECKALRSAHRIILIQ
jgi:hypothetical protein